MKTKHLYTTGFFAILIGCLGIMGSSVMAGSKNLSKLTKIKLSDLRLVYYEGQATLVDPTDQYIVLGGTRIPVVEGQRMGSGEVISTEIYNETGKKIPLSQLKNYDWVQVHGYRSNYGFIFAETIHKMAPKPGAKSGQSSEPQ